MFMAQGTYAALSLLMVSQPLCCHAHRRHDDFAKRSLALFTHHRVHDTQHHILRFLIARTRVLQFICINL